MPARVVALCGLSCVPGVGAATLSRILDRFGSAEEAAAAGGRGLLDEVTFRAKETRAYLAREPDLLELGRWAMGAAQAAGARVLALGDPDYPARLASTPSPPVVLYVRGRLGSAPRAAIVGSRKPDRAGEELAHRLSSTLARAGVEVVSGGARGIDTAAHEGAVRARGATVAVLGSGIDVPYPPENAGLFDRIVEASGAVVSELAPGTAPSPRNFPRRNRTVAGLCEATVVVRAAQKSGALITATQALAFGRAVFAVAGAPPGPLVAGTNALLSAGKARPFVSATALLSEVFGIEVEPGAPEEPREPAVVPEAAFRLDDGEAALFSLLDERTPAHVDELAHRANIPAQEALKRLAGLELKGACEQRPGKYFLRARG